MWRSLFRTGADPPAPSLSVHTPVKRAMTIDTKCLTVVDVEGRKRFVCDAPNVMRVQVDRIPSPASSAAALARVVILLEHGFSPHAVFWRQMRSLWPPSAPSPIGWPSKERARRRRVMSRDEARCLRADQHPAAAFARRPPCAASSVPAICTASGTKTLTSSLFLPSQAPDDFLADGTCDLHALGAVAAVANSSSHAA